MHSLPFKAVQLSKAGYLAWPTPRGNVWPFADSDKYHSLNVKYKSVVDDPMLRASFKLKHSIELTLPEEF